MTPQQHYAFTEIFELVTEEDCTIEDAAALTTDSLIEIYGIDEGSAGFLAKQAANLVMRELEHELLEMV